MNKNINFALDLLPTENNYYNLGSETLKWNNIYSNNFYGNFKGNADTATNASQHINNLENPHQVNKTQIGLSEVTNNRQIKGLQTQITEGNIVIWGKDGYSVEDSGFTIKTSVPPNAKFTDTVYAAARGLQLSYGAFGHINAEIAAGTIGATQNIVDSQFFYIPQISYDNFGHITNVSSSKVTLSIMNNKVNKIGDTMTGELVNTAANALRIYNNTKNKGILFRNDGTNFYLLNTSADSGDNYNSEIIPFYINLTTGNSYAHKIYGSVYNDYAEFRKTYIQEPGRCVREQGNDLMLLTDQRLQKGCFIISDTFGFSLGQTEECQTPIAVAGRVLAYPYESLETFKDHIGDPVCSGPNGTVSIMSQEEEQKYPSRIIGTISSVPNYKIWGKDNIKVNGRVWINIK